MSSIDPGGGSESPPDLSNLQANFGQQQVSVSVVALSEKWLFTF